MLPVQKLIQGLCGTKFWGKCRVGKSKKSKSLILILHRKEIVSQYLGSRENKERIKISVVVMLADAIS